MFVRPIQINITLPELRLEPTLPSLAIDAQDALNDIGLKAIGPLMREQAARAQAAGTEAIGNIAREGDRMAAVEISPDAIVEIAAEKWPPLRELNVDVQPKHRPVIEVQEGATNGELSPGEVRVEVPPPLNPGQWLDVRA